MAMKKFFSRRFQLWVHKDHYESLQKAALEERKSVADLIREGIELRLGIAVNKNKGGGSHGPILRTL